MTTPARRVALVTGTSNGLGAVIARALHGEGGCAVAVADIDVPKAGRVAAALDPAGDTAIALDLDVREKAAFERGLAALLERWGGAHVLVNNAAQTVARPVLEISAEEFDDVLATNLRGTFFGCQVFGRHFATRPAAASSTWPRSPGRMAARRRARTTPPPKAASSPSPKFSPAIWGPPASP